MFGHNIGSILTSNLSVLEVFNVHNLSVGQLFELGYRITFIYFGCIVQDSRTRQELGTSPRVGSIFFVDNLRLPPIAYVSVAAVAITVSYIPSLALWRA